MGIQEKFTQSVVSNPDLSNAAVKIGAWLAGCMSLAGADELELSMNQISDGMTLPNGKTVDGTGSRPETVRSALAALEEAGIIGTYTGKPIGFGHNATVIRFTV